MSKKRIYLVTKTHLDLGYTNLASNILNEYVHKFIPKAIEIAKELNTEKKKFVWTTGSWILNKALQVGTKDEIANLTSAMQRGDIVSHALPFTTHTELMDEETFRYGLSIIKKLDKLFNRNTIAAKMTDVPGHTIAMVPLLQEYGIKMLHIGVNESSAVPNIPDVFLWKYQDSEVVVVYNKSYGGDFTYEGIDSMVAFCHTSDNCGPVNLEQARENYIKYSTKYPDAKVIASGLDEIAAELWEVRHTLPIVTSEIGDSWIHGSTTDPFKAAALRELMALKRNWMKEKSMIEGSKEYESFSDALLCLAEHTNGGDIKTMLSDYTNYLKKDFKKAKKKNIVSNSEEALNAEDKIASRIIGDIKEKDKELSYSRIEATWFEQREYINEAINALSLPHKIQAQEVITKLIPKKGFKIKSKLTSLNESMQFKLGEYSISLNKFGALGLRYKANDILLPSGESTLVDYVSHSLKDVNTFFDTYNRPDVKGMNWAYGDFGRPAFSLVDGKYPFGRFSYVIKSLEENDDSIKMLLTTNKEITKQLGAPREISIKLSAQGKKFIIELIWTGKDSNRIQEETLLRLYPNTNKKNILYNKLGNYINPYDVVESGNRSNSAVLNIHCLSPQKQAFTITNIHCPLVSLGKGKIMLFDNIFEDVEKDGLSYILHNNIWGTNFPLYYSDNAYFKTEIEIE